MLDAVRLGRTGLMVTRVSMGCLPIQRLTEQAAVTLLLQAYDAGINLYDTAYVYTDSEAKLGAAFSGARRQNIVIATKTMSESYETTMSQLDESLQRLKTEYIDIYQWHNPKSLESFQEERGPYQAMKDAQKAGKIRFIGITNHNLSRAHEAIDSNAFDTMQYPLSVLSTADEFAMAQKCAEHDMGVMAMKAMCGGLLDDGRVPFAFLNQYSHIIPIWGIEKPQELAQFLSLAREQEPFTPAMREAVEAIRAEYGDSFCRGCGYCLPCPSEINIPILMRIEFLIKRNADGTQFTSERLAEIESIDTCTECQSCMSRCPYHLDIPAQLKEQQRIARAMYAAYMAKTDGQE